MSNVSSNGKPLRFAALIRVSTERQEKQGESLRTQASQIEQAVKALSGRIVQSYAGQEHATAGWERQQRDKMLAEAEKDRKPFDAVMVAHEDRWSRDDTRSGADLERLQQAGVRFFVLDREQDLSDPTARLYLGMSAVIGAYHARNQKKKSIENRIERAKRGIPTCGSFPFGRAWDVSKQAWIVDPEKQALIEDVAKRYLAGEPLRKLAREHGMNLSNLHKVLTKRCGGKWEQEFRSDDLNIREVVETPIPRLLPEETIEAIRQRVEANKTYQHGQPKHKYLFGRMVFCAHCGYAMFGQCDPRNGHRYYRHAHLTRDKKCPCSKAWVKADELEDAVFAELFVCFGNPVAVKKAIEEATPNRDQINALRQRSERTAGELAKVKKAKERIIDHIAEGTITDEEVAKKMTGLREREGQLQGELDRLATQLENVPTEEAIKAVAKRVSAKFKKHGVRYIDGRLHARINLANVHWQRMTWQEKRSLAEMVFSGKTADGKRMGVHVEWIKGQERRRRKAWRFRIVGHLIDALGRVPGSMTTADPEYGHYCGAPEQSKLLGLTKCASSGPSVPLLARPPKPCYMPRLLLGEQAVAHEKKERIPAPGSCPAFAPPVP